MVPKPQPQWSLHASYAEYAFAKDPVRLALIRGLYWLLDWVEGRGGQRQRDRREVEELLACVPPPLSPGQFGLGEGMLRGADVRRKRERIAKRQIAGVAYASPAAVAHAARPTHVRTRRRPRLAPGGGPCIMDTAR